MFSSLSTLSSSASTTSNSTSSATTEISGAVQSQSLEEKISLTSKEEVERKLTSILTQVEQNQTSRLNLTATSLGHFYELTHMLSGYEHMILNLAVLKNGALAFGSGDKTIKIWDLTSHSCLSTLQGHSCDVNALAALPNGQLASGSADKTIKLWDLTSYSCLSTLQGHSDSVRALAVLSNGLLASGSFDETIRLWDLTSHSCLSILQGHTNGVCTLAILPNGLLASGSSDCTIRLWDLTSGSCLSTLQGHTGDVSALAILPNGQLASSSNDRTIKLWDLTSHACLSTLQGHTGDVSALAILPNGQLASGSWDKTIKIWELRTLSAKQLTAILNALKNNASVTELDLSGNRDILDDIIDPLIATFAPDTSLETIDLRRTRVSKKGVKKLEKAVQSQQLSIEVLADCPIEWMMIYFLIIFSRANRNSPFADSGLDICKYGELGPFLDVPSGLFARSNKPASSQKHATLSPS